MAIGFTDYQGHLADVATAISAANWSGARIALALAKVTLAALPETILTGQQMTRFMALKELNNLGDAITEAQIATDNGDAGTGLGLAQTVGVY